MGYTGVVHTKSSYAGSDIGFLEKENNIQGKINNLRAKENGVYASLIPGCNSIEKFLTELRLLFADERDAQVFRFFENVNISRALQHNFGTTTKAKQQDIIININGFNQELDLSSLLSGVNYSVVGNSSINLGVDIHNIKMAFNRLFGTKLKHKASESKRRLNQLLNDSNALTNMLQLDTEEMVTVSASGKLKSETLNYKIIKPGSIFSYTAEDIREAIKLGETSELYQELQKAKSEILNFIKNQSGYHAASNEMKMAIDNVWQRNLEDKFESLALFEKGGGLNFLNGAFGEFQAALLTEYINQKVKNSKFSGSFISKTIKSNLEDPSKQAKIDVTIFNNIGIQVKNYNTFSAQKGNSLLEVKTTPGKIVNFPDFPYEKTSFLDFLANYFFNKSYQESNGGIFSSLEKNLQGYFAEVANLAITEEVDDLVTFYFIEGKYFLPTSYILEQWYNQTESSKFTAKVQIKGTNPEFGDEDYAEIISGSKKDRPRFTKWWISSASESGWAPRQPQNSGSYQGLINNSISIQSSFNYLKIAGGFSLF